MSSSDDPLVASPVEGDEDSLDSPLVPGPLATVDDDDPATSVSA